VRADLSPEERTLLPDGELRGARWCTRSSHWPPCSAPARRAEAPIASLRLARDGGGEDSLLASLARARDRMLAAQRDLRLLLAYAREFAEPRTYRLDDLAQAAGMSISGIRTAYDDDKITQVAEMSGLQPRLSPR
jgi:hypothetical protein